MNKGPARTPIVSSANNCLARKGPSRELEGAVAPAAARMPCCHRAVQIPNRMMVFPNEVLGATAIITCRRGVLRGHRADDGIRHVVEKPSQRLGLGGPR